MCLFHKLTKNSLNRYGVFVLFEGVLDDFIQVFCLSKLKILFSGEPHDSVLGTQAV